MSFFHTDKPTRTLSQQIITAFNKMIGVINLRYFILIIGHIDIHPDVYKRQALVIFTESTRPGAFSIGTRYIHSPS